MKSHNQIAVLILASFLAAGCGRSQTESGVAPDMPGEAPTVPDLRTLLADESRAAEDRARDAGRKPADVVEFLGIREGMHVIDIIAGAGYYTEVLSIAVGPDGRVVAQNPDFVLQFRDGANEKAISARLGGNRLPNVTRLNKNFDAISAADGAFDAAVTALNFHDIYNRQGAEGAVAFLQTIGSVLQPGAILGIIDHVGVAGADNAALHRIEPRQVIEAAEAAGFELWGQSGLLANGDDEHDQGVFAEGLRGHTDRFVLQFRKPSD